MKLKPSNEVLDSLIEEDREKARSLIDHYFYFYYDKNVCPEPEEIAFGPQLQKLLRITGDAFFSKKLNMYRYIRLAVVDGDKVND